jgi:hypothetical protein
LSEFYSDNGENDPFWDSMGQQDGSEETAAEEPEAAADEPAAEAEPESEGRARNPDGTFAAKVEDEPVEAEEPVAEEVAEPSDAETLRAQIAQLEKRLADKDEFAGKMSNELGELRKLQEQIAESQSRPHVSDWDSLIDSDPFQAYQLALQSGDQYRISQAREAWNDLAPGVPAMFDANRALYGEVQALQNQVKQTTASQSETQQTQQMAQAYSAIKEKYPDYDKFEDAMAEAVETRPLLKKALTESLASGDANEQYAVLEDLYLVTAGRNSDTLRDAKQQAAQSFAAETLQAKQDAIVASSTSTPVEEPRSRHDDLWALGEEDEAIRSAGWNIRR